MLAHVQLVLLQDPKVFLCRAALKLVNAQHVLVPGVTPPQVLHGMLTVVSTRARTDYVFLIEVDRGFDQNISNIYRILTKTKCLSTQPSTDQMEHSLSTTAFQLNLARAQTFEKLDTIEGGFLFPHSAIPLQISLVSATL